MTRVHYFVIAKLKTCLCYLIFCVISVCVKADYHLIEKGKTSFGLEDLFVLASNFCFALTVWYYTPLHKIRGTGKTGCFT